MTPCISAGLVADFDVPDQLDFADINFISGTTSASWNQLSGSSASGMLTVTDTVHSANITLLGQYAAVERNQRFLQVLQSRIPTVFPKT